MGQLSAKVDKLRSELRSLIDGPALLRRSSIEFGTK